MAPLADGEAIRHIDANILILEEEIRKLREQRNTKLAIACLPAEVLIHIFTRFVPKPDHDQDFPQDPILGKKTRSQPWLSFTHVCRTWRSLALTCPFLWTYPDFLSPALAKAMFERSGLANIDINIPHGDCVSDTMLSQLEGSLSRMRTLVVIVSRPPLQKFISHLRQPAPTLSSIYITHTSKMPGFFLPSQFLGGEAPLLTEIRLVRCYLPWTSSLLENVTILSLGGDGVSNIPTASRFLIALRGIRRLQVLELRNIFPETIRRASEVHLPYLRRLLLKMSTNHCVNILDHVTFPGTASLILECFPVSEGQSAFEALFSCLSRLNSGALFGRTGTRTLKTVAIDIFQYRGLERVCFTGWAAGDIIFPASRKEDSQLLPPPAFKLALECNEQMNWPLQPHHVTEALGVLHLNSLETLLLQGRCDSDLRDRDASSHSLILIDLLGDLLWSTSIRSLVLRGSDLGYLGAKSLGVMRGGRYPDACVLGANDTDLVLANTESGAHDQSHSFVLPALQHLVLCSAYLDDQPITVRKSLVYSFTSRGQHGFEMPKLILKSCNFKSTSDGCEDLKKIFRDIEIEDPQPSFFLDVLSWLPSGNDLLH